MKLKAIGCVNAAHSAYLKNAKGEIIGECMDTPNCIAYAMAVNLKVSLAITSFNGNYSRKDLQSRFDSSKLNASYFQPYVKFLSK